MSDQLTPKVCPSKYEQALIAVPGLDGTTNLEIREGADIYCSADCLKGPRREPRTIAGFSMPPFFDKKICSFDEQPEVSEIIPADSLQTP